MEFADVNSQRAAKGKNANLARRPAARAAMSSKIGTAVTVMALVALAFPNSLMFDLDGRVIFLHYLALAIAIPLLILLRQATLQTVKPVLPVLGMISVSTLINYSSADLVVVFFHVLHLIAIMLLAACPGAVAMRFAKVTIMIYAVAILLAQILILVGASSIVEWLLISNGDGGAARVAAFATEPSYAAMLLLIFTRFVMVFEIEWLNPRRLGVIIGALLATLSLFALISALLILAMYLYRRGDIRAMVLVLAGGGMLLTAVSFTGFFTDRISALDLSLGAEGLGTGSVRLQPYLYMGTILPSNPWPLLFGAGAGYLEQAFYYDLGNFGSSASRLTMHMAGPIYDYGLAAVLPILFMWNRPENLGERSLYLLMAVAVMLNTGIGSYLFIIFGTFALLEQRFRTQSGRSSTPAAQTARKQGKRHASATA
ncbi:hypothetical protein MACH24_30710 [Erythrobacter sp. Dej080120_24]|uniref:hypothetical protein n=1 Tax=Erythrobacter sp. Dej080120_24 TaxID=3024837 RepID=UPI0029216CF8|nr:hypothetical protein MACH24_30710 [Erythrobacter sp. Dej080120_24]